MASLYMIPYAQIITDSADEMVQPRSRLAHTGYCCKTALEQKNLFLLFRWTGKIRPASCFRQSQARFFELQVSFQPISSFPPELSLVFVPVAYNETYPARTPPHPQNFCPKRICRNTILILSQNGTLSDATSSHTYWCLSYSAGSFVFLTLCTMGICQYDIGM
jgi:hypothetical protein